MIARRPTNRQTIVLFIQRARRRMLEGCDKVGERQRDGRFFAAIAIGLQHDGQRRCVRCHDSHIDPVEHDRRGLPDTERVALIHNRRRRIRLETKVTNL